MYKSDSDVTVVGINHLVINAIAAKRPPNVSLQCINLGLILP